MKIVNKTLLNSYLRPGKCEWCGKWVSSLCGAHVFSRGTGRLDIKLNLVALGLDPLKDCTCHHDSHARGEPSQEDLLAVVAARENALQDDIKEVIWLLRRLPKAPRLSEIEEGLAGLSTDGKRLARRVVREAGF